MGKKARKTRWRTLTIADEHSDSEESSTTTAPRLPNGYQPKSYYNKFSYSSQSTPRRRYQQDSTKSTRSSSTASETKITFNEDEYTRITTPRQDVLFKKGYLNKPKTYQTQTSTGTSTTSTGNSTGNGTPDHQSTDLDYESQFVFPNGFVDQNGIYYVNSYESYPLMVYNPQTYYPEFSNCKSKRYSTGSLTESMSPNNEEATSQDLSGGEASNNVSDYSGHHQVYNMVYPGYYVNGGCPTNDVANGQCPTDQTRRIKKRRRRKTSKSQTAQDNSEYTDDESDSCDEEKPQNHSDPPKAETDCHNTEEITKIVVEETINAEVKEEIILGNEETQSNGQNELEDKKNEETSKEIQPASPVEVEEDHEKQNCLKDEQNSTENHQPTSQNVDTPTNEINSSDEHVQFTKSDLKPDAEEFIPRAYRNSDIPQSPNVQYIKVPPNFVPIPMVSLGDFNGQNFNPAFIPPGIPLNFLPPDPKLFPNFVGFVPSTPFVPKTHSEIEQNQQIYAENRNNQSEIIESCDKSTSAKEEIVHQHEEPEGKNLVQNVNRKTIDIATIVSKLEEAAKEQQDEDAKKTDETQNSPRRKYYENKHFRANQKYKNTSNYRRNHYNNPQNSPQKRHHYVNEDVAEPARETSSNNLHTSDSSIELPPESKLETSQSGNLSKGVPQVIEVREETQGDGKYQKYNPEKSRKNWKQHQGSPKWQPNGVVKDFRLRNNAKIYLESDTKDFKAKTNNKNYSDLLKNRMQNQVVEQKYYVGDKQRRNVESPQKEVTTETTSATVIPSPKQINQWISVSSRKKRKNKNIEESDASFAEQFEENREEHSQTDLFESYDVNQLVDVIPTKTEDEEIITVETTGEIEIEKIINNIKHDEKIQVDNNSLNISMRSVSEIEKELIIKTDAPVPDEETQKVDTSAKEEIVSEEQAVAVEELAELNTSSVHEEGIKIKGRKKSKKGTQKPLAKRIIITDVDLSMKCEDIKPAIKKVVTKLEDAREQKKELALPKAQEDIIAEESPNNCDEDEKKKSKKKKKKPIKTTTSNSSLSSSNTTINVAEDSYEFLLDSALTEESVEKTNIEISQEFDKIIQKGMYSSLEEKMRSLNIDESDGFFKSIFSKISSRESSVEKTCFTKTPDLSKILQNTSTLLKPRSVSQENNSQNKEINTILPDLDSPVEDGFFLENPDANEIPRDRTVTKDTEKEETQIEHPTEDCKITKLDIEIAPTTLYPITQAVKEWMSKTRETTPDVEILKSPRAIYKEFCDSASETDTQTSESKNLSLPEKLNTDDFDEEETIIFRAERHKNTEQSDLQLVEMEEVRENINKPSENDNSKDFIEKDCLDTHIEEGEDVMEVYESKYGKNEDYLNLQKEVREKTNNINYPKHGNLPYRAICCSIM